MNQVKELPRMGILAIFIPQKGYEFLISPIKWSREDGMEPNLVNLSIIHLPKKYTLKCKIDAQIMIY